MFCPVDARKIKEEKERTIENPMHLGHLSEKRTVREPSELLFLRIQSPGERTARDRIPGMQPPRCEARTKDRTMERFEIARTGDPFGHTVPSNRKLRKRRSKMSLLLKKLKKRVAQRRRRKFLRKAIRIRRTIPYPELP
jgi:hypothetical protein